MLFCKTSSNPSSFILIISFKKCNCLTIHAPKVQGMNQLKLVICYGTDNQDNVFTLLGFQEKSKLDLDDSYKKIDEFTKLKQHLLNEIEKV